MISVVGLDKVSLALDRLKFLMVLLNFEFLFHDRNLIPDLMLGCTLNCLISVVPLIIHVKSPVKRLLFV